MFFEFIRMSKKRSIQNNDLDTRTATVLTQLWSSTRVFKFKDGSTDGLRLFLRGRLVSVKLSTKISLLLIDYTVPECSLRLALVVACRVWRKIESICGAGTRPDAIFIYRS
jgi:hypothetical protein